ncbi:MAG TPA: NRDE family protein [Kofleriaceae bacterium]|nr:NRDE family protein [Kofleriaceae bacterium]
MCTAILLYRVHPRYPVIIAANRDEQIARPARGIEVVAPGVVAGIDAARGGSWAGATAAGGFALLTNRRQTQKSDPPPPASRGEIVLACLSAGTRAAMGEVVGGLDPHRYGPFNLLFGDGHGVSLAASRQGASAIEVSAVSEGLHVLTHHDLDAPPEGKIARARALFAPLARSPWPDFQRAAHAALGDHHHPGLGDLTPPPGPPPTDTPLADALAAICVHTAHYATRSATLLAIAEDHTAHYLYAPGPPCETDFTTVTHLLR